MDLSYLFTPFFAWIITGIAKFINNCFNTKRLAFDLIGYGGMPSNHSAIVASTASIIAFKEGISHPAFGVAITLAFIVILDAHGLRGEVEKHSKAINKLKSTDSFRESFGHNKCEIFWGIIVGILSAWLIHLLYN